MNILQHSRESFCRRWYNGRILLQSCRPFATSHSKSHILSGDRGQQFHFSRGRFYMQIRRFVTCVPMSRDKDWFANRTRETFGNDPSDTKRRLVSNLMESSPELLRRRNKVHRLLSIFPLRSALSQSRPSITARVSLNLPFHYQYKKRNVLENWMFSLRGSRSHPDDGKRRKGKMKMLNVLWTKPSQPMDLDSSYFILPQPDDTIYKEH